MVITLWEEGFTLSTNPTELRPYNEPKNAKFMEELKQGVVPTELRNNSNSKGLSVSLEDKRSKSFHKAQGPIKPSYFGGKGVSLQEESGQAPPKKIDLSNKSSVQRIGIALLMSIQDTTV